MAINLRNRHELPRYTVAILHVYTRGIVGHDNVYTQCILYSFQIHSKNYLHGTWNITNECSIPAKVVAKLSLSSSLTTVNCPSSTPCDSSISSSWSFLQNNNKFSHIH